MADFRDTRDSVARRVMARASGAGPVGERGIGDGRLDRWKGGGGYYYEITDEGIKVTGSESSKTLQGGKSVILPWDNKDPKNLAMIDAILQERGGRDSVLGASPEPTPPAPKPEEASQEMQTGSAREVAGLPPTADETRRALDPKLDTENAKVIVPTAREMSDKAAYDWETYGTSEPAPKEWDSVALGESEQMAGGKYDPAVGVDQSIVPLPGEERSYKDRRMAAVLRAMEPKAQFSDPGPTAEELGRAGESEDVIYRPPESESREGLEIPNEELAQMTDEELEALGFTSGRSVKMYDANKATNRYRSGRR